MVSLLAVYRTVESCRSWPCLALILMYRIVVTSSSWQCLSLLAMYIKSSQQLVVGNVCYYYLRCTGQWYVVTWQITCSNVRAVVNSKCWQCLLLLSMYRTVVSSKWQYLSFSNDVQDNHKQ